MGGARDLFQSTPTWACRPAFNRYLKGDFSDGKGPYLLTMPSSFSCQKGVIAGGKGVVSALKGAVMSGKGAFRARGRR